MIRKEYKEVIEGGEQRAIYTINSIGIA